MLDPKETGSPPADLMEDNEGSHIIKGLKNLGNTCFFNVVVQILLALDNLRKIILRPDVRIGPLAMLLKELFLKTSEAKGAVDPKKLFSYICSKKSQFEDGGHHCAHEFFLWFCDSLCDEETSEWKKVENGGSASHITTIVDFICTGYLSYTTSRTKCKHISFPNDVPFRGLILSCPSRAQGLPMILMLLRWMIVRVLCQLRNAWICIARKKCYLRAGVMSARQKEKQRRKYLY